MKRFLAFCFVALSLAAAVRVNISIDAGHPIHRARTVVVHRAPLVVGARIAYAPLVVWSREPVVIPRRERLIWEDREVIRRDEDWVDTFLPVRNSGSGLVLRIDGRAQVDFAEVHFRDGQVQVVDFHEQQLDRGTFTLHNFRGGRFVENVRIVARARTPQATLAVLMRK